MAELSGRGSAMNILWVLARRSLGVYLALLIPLWIFDDPCSRPTPVALGLRLLPWLMLAVLQGILVMGDPPVDPR